MEMCWIFRGGKFSSEYTSITLLARKSYFCSSILFQIKLVHPSLRLSIFNAARIYINSVKLASFTLLLGKKEKSAGKQEFDSNFKLVEKSSSPFPSRGWPFMPALFFFCFLGDGRKCARANMSPAYY